MGNNSNSLLIRIKATRYKFMQSLKITKSLCNVGSLQQINSIHSTSKSILHSNLSSMSVRLMSAKSALVQPITIRPTISKPTSTPIPDCIHSLSNQFTKIAKSRGQMNYLMLRGLSNI